MKTLLLLLLITISVMAKAEKNTKENELVLGGGCFWCTEAIFKKLKGVSDVMPGYAGGEMKNPTYNDVVTGETGHAEVVKIVFNPNQISKAKILEVFFLTHDPTTLNRQGADVGTQYRSVIFYSTPLEKEFAQNAIYALDESKVYSKKIVTTIEKLDAFYVAENYHHNYFERNQQQPYCLFVIQPKVEKLKKVFDDLLK